MSAFARTTGVFIGTSESSLQSVSAGATNTGSEVDMLGDNLSTGSIWAYAYITATAASSGSVRINNRRVTGQAYQYQNYQFSITTINGTVKVPLGPMKASRYMTADYLNNDGSNAVSVLVAYELEKLTPP